MSIEKQETGQAGSLPKDVANTAAPIDIARSALATVLRESLSPGQTSVVPTARVVSILGFLMIASALVLGALQRLFISQPVAIVLLIAGTILVLVLPVVQQLDFRHSNAQRAAITAAAEEIRRLQEEARKQAAFDDKLSQAF